jgi:acetylornithine deacetylase/succinyl-diaminopimelate desuccinylase-like protein
MRYLLAYLCALAALSSAAEPDWPRAEQHAVDLLRRYIQIPSVNPPANTAQAAALLQGELAANGLEATLFPSAEGGKTNLLVRLPGRDRSAKPLLLLNHMDVVPADASRWKINPFGAVLQDGQIWGRGALDMKSTGIMQLSALVLLKQTGVVPPRDIVLLAVCDEETGGVEGAAWMIEHHWAQLDPAYVLDEGGVGSRDLYSPGKLIFGISVAEKQLLWLRMRAQGTSGHGSQPIPDNANDLLIRAIQKAKEFPASSKPVPALASMRAAIGTFASNKFVNAIQQTTMSVTSLRSGVGNPPKANVIPSIAEATLDCRLMPGVNAEEFISEIKARVNDPHVTLESISPPPEDPRPSSPDTPLFKAISAAIKKSSPDAAVAPIVVPFGTDGEKFRTRGVQVYGIMPMIIDASTMATMHSDSEHIPVEQFVRGLHIYFDILRSSY